MLTLLRSALLVSAISVAANAGHSHEARQVANRTSSSPNFVFIITDDQDAGTATPEIMPLLTSWFKTGSNYSNFYTPLSQCCPSRVTFLRGQQPHNHNITDVSLPYGGWEVFNAYGYGNKWLPSWLQAVGYSTWYTGKLMNGQTTANAVAIPTQGFNGSDIFLDPSTYNYYNTSITHNNEAPRVIANYSTDLARDYALGYLDTISAARLRGDSAPFFVGIAPIAPHFVSGPRGNASNPDFFITYPPIPAPRHANLFNTSTLPPKSSYNANVSSGAGWVYDLPVFNETVSAYNQEWYRLRLRALQAVDELVDAVFKKLQANNLLDNTYIIYTGDNGFSIGEHRRPPGKCAVYEEDTRVPFFVRGPGVATGQVSNVTHSMTDAGTTLLYLAGADTDLELDGRIMPWGNKGASKSQLGSANFHLTEYWNSPLLEGIYGATFLKDKTKYRSLRVIEEGNNYMYSIWCTGQRELYNMAVDSSQMNNLLSSQWSLGPAPAWNVSGSSALGLRVASRLDAALLFQKTCKGRTCRTNWANLFPYGEVTSLAQALDTKYDFYFNSLPKLNFSDCTLGYRVATELPLWSTDLAYYAPKYVANSSYTRRALQDNYLILVD